MTRREPWSQLAVTVPWSLRHRVQVAAAEADETVWEWVADALRVELERRQQGEFARIMARGVRRRLIRERLRAMLGAS